jgi:predicted MFS family arabinose efflux permease
LFQLVYGPLADRVGRVPIVAFALGGFALGSVASALAPGLNWLVLARLWTGLTAAAIFPLALTYIGDTVEYRRRQHAIGYLIMASALGQVLSSAIGGLLAAAISWRAIFLIDGVGAVAISGLILREPLARQRSRLSHQATSQAYGLVLRDRRHVLFYLMIFIEGAFTIGAFSFFGALLRDRDGYSYGAIGLMIGLFGLSSLIVGRYIGGVVRRLGERRMIAIGGAGVAATFALVVMEPAVPFFLIAMLLGGATYIMLHSTLQTRATEIAPGARATGISLFAFALFLGSSLGALVVAASIDSAGYGVTMLAMAGIAAAFTAVAIFAIAPWSQPAEAVATGTLAPETGAP